MNLHQWRCRYCGEMVDRRTKTCYGHRDLPALDHGADVFAGWATIQAVDTDDSTIYILCQEFAEPVSAHWPHPLEALRPDAIRIPAYDTANTGHTLAVTVGNLKPMNVNRWTVWDG